MILKRKVNKRETVDDNDLRKSIKIRNWLLVCVVLLLVVYSIRNSHSVISQLQNQDYIRYIPESARSILNQNLSSSSSSSTSSPTTQTATENDDTNTAPFTSCSSFITNSDTYYPSTSSIWHRLRKQILNASYFPEKFARVPVFRQWVENLLEFHTESRLRRSVSHSADPLAIQKILQIIKDRQEGGDEQLRIMVLGGSVTVGHNCGVNPLGLESKSWTQPDKSCAWPVRLEHMFNQVLFGGDSVVNITNIAAGGSSSEVATVVMEYHLFPNPKELPHIIVSAHAPNDVQQPSLDNVFYIEMQDLIQSAKNVRPCDEHLPLVVMAEDFYGYNDLTKQSLLSGYISALASWYDVMAFNHQNIARHQLISNHENTTAIEQLMGSNFNLHSGMGFHIGMAWTALFNFLNAFIDTCNDLAIIQGNNDSNSTTTKIDSVLESPSIKHISKLSQGKGGMIADVLDRWKQREEETKNRCSLMENETETSLCSYAWMVNRQSGVSSLNDLIRVMDPILQSNQGWKAAGRPVRQPRIGWYAQETNATFALNVLVTVPTNFLTIVSMKSYGPTWVGSKLEVTIQIHRSNVWDPTSSNQEINNTLAIHEIDGYHSIQTSVHFPHKFELPENGANVGDTISVQARLVGGSMFKVNGIAFCRF